MNPAIEQLIVQSINDSISYCKNNGLDHERIPSSKLNAIVGTHLIKLFTNDCVEQIRTIRESEYEQNQFIQTFVREVNLANPINSVDEFVEGLYVGLGLACNILQQRYGVET